MDISRRVRPVVAATAALAATAVLTVAVPATIASGNPTTRHRPSQKPTIVLVHGAWADASSWTPGAPAGDVDLYLKPALFPQLFANGLPAATAAELAAAQRPITLSALSEPSGPPAWKTLPSWYVVGTLDNILPPALQLSMAGRAGSRVTEIPGPHLSMLTNPGTVTHVIEEAGRATSGD